MTGVALSWSGGKDSALALRALREELDSEPVALLTTVTEDYGRVSMHGVRRELARAQACAAGLPLVEVAIPAGCSNERYELRMAQALDAPPLNEVSTIAFADLFLEDVRAYRVQRLASTGREAIFPLWGRDTRALAHEFVEAGFKAVLVCVDPTQLDVPFAGRAFDIALLRDLPPSADPCGENGEFHTFVHAAPIFERPIEIELGETVTRGGFVFQDLIPLAPADQASSPPGKTDRSVCYSPGMARTMTQTEKAEETRRRIVRAAAELFAEHGYAATSLSDVIAAAGSTKGGFYFHFTSKAELGLAVVADAREQFTGEVLAATGEYERASDQLVATVRAVAEHSKAKPAASGIGRLCMELREEPQIAIADLDPYGGWVRIVRGLLERAQHEGDLDPRADALESARYAVGAYVGVESLAIDARDDFLDRIDEHLRLTLRAIALRSALLDQP